MKAGIDLSLFSATDREECGILVGEYQDDGSRLVTRVVKVENLATDPENDYAISMLDFEITAKALGPGEHIVGFLHTHLDKHDAEPTPQDYEGAKIFPHFLNLVYKPSTGEKTWYSGVRIRGHL